MMIKRLITIRAIAFPSPPSHSTHFLSMWTCIEPHSFFSPFQTACNGWRFFDRHGISFKKQKLQRQRAGGYASNQTPLCGSSPKQQDLVVAVPIAQQECAKHSSTLAAPHTIASGCG